MNPILIGIKYMGIAAEIIDDLCFGLQAAGCWPFLLDIH
jgi:hypothetical protein